MSRERIEEWWPLVARILMFFVGAAVFVHQAVVVPNPPGAQESLIAASLGLMGPLAATLAAGALEKARGGNGRDPA